MCVITTTPSVATDIMSLTPDYASYYGKHILHMLAAQRRVLDIADEYERSHRSDEIKAIRNKTTRIKSPESMRKKLEKRGMPTDVETALSSMHDYVGVRIVCAFVDDVYKFIDWLDRDMPDIDILERKDYISHPKPSGYRSYHVILKLNGDGSELGDGYVVELQVRTIAMDFWASLEHMVNYKHDIRNKELISDELRRCADENASNDISMQTIRDLIEEENGKDRGSSHSGCHDG